MKPYAHWVVVHHKQLMRSDEDRDWVLNYAFDHWEESLRLDGYARVVGPPRLFIFTDPDYIGGRRIVIEGMVVDAMEDVQGA